MAYYSQTESSPTFEFQQLETRRWISTLENTILAQEITGRTILPKNIALRGLSQAIINIQNKTFDGIVLFDSISLMQNLSLATKLIKALKKGNKSLYLVSTKQFLSPIPDKSVNFDLLTELIIAFEIRKKGKKSEDLHNSQKQIGRPLLVIAWSQFDKLRQSHNVSVCAEKMGMNYRTLLQKLKTRQMEEI